MTPANEQTNYFKALEGLLEEYTAWYNDVSRATFYPQQIDYNKVSMRHDDFVLWARSVEAAGIVAPGSMKDLLSMHEELSYRAGRLMAQAEHTHKLPVFEDFDALATYFEEFMRKARRIEHDVLLGEQGIDPQTGLRRAALMEQDIKRELDRLERQGKPFSLALIRINHFDRFMKFLPPREAQEALMRVVDLVKRNLRSYDDAYYLDDGVFAMSLKQTTQIGAAKALARMKNELEDMNSVYSLDGIRTVLTLSSCVAEPVPENDVQDLVHGLMEQIKRAGEGDVVVQYQEVSALQRFLQQTKGE